MRKCEDIFFRRSKRGIMMRIKTDIKGKILATVLMFVMFVAQIAVTQAGTISNISFVTDPDGHLSSTWAWTIAGGDWATAPVRVVNDDWEVTLQGFANFSLRDTSAHLVAPHGGIEIAPNFLSFFNYAGATVGIGPVVTVFEHPAIPDHFDQFELTTSFGGISSVLIEFNAWHMSPPLLVADARTAVPEPGTLLLLGTGLLGLIGYGWRRRKLAA